MKVNHEVTERANIVCFTIPMRSVSSAIVGGGVLNDVLTVVNYSLGKTENTLPDDIVSYTENCFNVETELSNKMVVICTVVPAEHSKACTVFDELTGLEAHAFVTAGLGNRRSFEDPAVCNEEADRSKECRSVGTINIILAVNRPLTIEAHLELYALIAQIKVHVVESFRLPSPVSGLVSSGTGTDCVVVCAPMINQVDVPPLQFAGMYTMLAKIAGSAVSTALTLAIQGWMTAHTEVRPLKHC